MTLHTNSSGLTRASLIARACDHQSQAWHELVDLYGPLIAHWCSRCGLDSHSTADRVQEVFAAVAKSLHRFNPAKTSGAFRSWLWTITANIIRDAHRREQRQARPVGGSSALQLLHELPDAQLTDEPTSPDELKNLIARGLAQVQAEYEIKTWEIFQRSIVDQISTNEVAAQFGVSPATVRQVRSRILRRLRQQLGDL